MWHVQVGNRDMEGVEFIKLAHESSGMTCMLRLEDARVVVANYEIDQDFWHATLFPVSPFDVPLFDEEPSLAPVGNAEWAQAKRDELQKIRTSRMIITRAELEMLLKENHESRAPVCDLLDCHDVDG